MTGPLPMVHVPRDAGPLVIRLVGECSTYELSASAAWALAARLVKAVREVAPDAVGLRAALDQHSADDAGPDEGPAASGADLFKRGRG